MRHVTWFATMLLGAVSVSAWAGDTDVSTAAELFKQGRAAMARGEWQLACDSFAKSEKLDPRVGTLLNLAQCEESRGRLRVAGQIWRDAAELARVTQDARESIARGRIVEIEKRIPTLLLEVEAGVAGITVSCDGVAATVGKAFQVDPGAHEIVVTAPGRSSASTAVVVKESEQRVVHLRVGAPVVTRPTTPDTPREPSSVRSSLAWGLGGLSLASFAVGGWFGAQAIRRNDDSKRFCDANNACQPEGLDLRADAGRDARVSTIAFAIGGVALTGAVVVWLTTPRPTSQPAITLAISPADIRLEGRW